MIVLAKGWTLDSPATPTFSDVLPGSWAFPYVETAYGHHIISGYSCGGTGEPCDPQNRPYFRENANASRGQIAKIVYLSILAGPGTCTLLPTPTP